MKLWYKRQHSESYMIVEDGVESGGYEEQMLKRNSVKALLDFYTLPVDGQTQFWYTITGKESLKDYFESEKMTKENLSKLVLYMHLAFEEIDKYLIKQEHVWISPETVYLEKSKSDFKLSLCYYPVEHEAVTVQFRYIMEYLIGIVDHDDEPLRQLVYDMYDISMHEDYCLMDLMGLLEGDAEEDDDIYVEEISMEDPMNRQPDPDWVFEEGLFAEGEEKGVFRRIRDWLAGIFSKKKQEDNIVRRFEDFEYDPDVEVSEPTVLLNMKKTRCAGKLLYDGSGNEDNYIIERDVFRIGNKTERNDAGLSSKAVSRHHAKITRKKGDYYIEDLNSTNGTYLNGRLLNYNEPVKLKVMDELQFGDVAYIFM